MTIPSLYGIGSFVVGCVFLAAAAFSGARASKIVFISFRSTSRASGSRYSGFFFLPAVLPSAFGSRRLVIPWSCGR